MIRAQDKLAPSMVDYYLALYQAVEVLHPGTLDNEVIAELEHHRVAIEKWQQEHPTKYADR